MSKRLIVEVSYLYPILSMYISIQDIQFMSKRVIVEMFYIVHFYPQ
jgi:hypothetical protein